MGLSFHSYVLHRSFSWRELRNLRLLALRLLIRWYVQAVSQTSVEPLSLDVKPWQGKASSGCTLAVDCALPDEPS